MLKIYRKIRGACFGCRDTDPTREGGNEKEKAKDGKRYWKNEQEQVRIPKYT